MTIYNRAIQLSDHETADIEVRPETGVVGLGLPTLTGEVVRFEFEANDWNRIVEMINKAEGFRGQHFSTAWDGQ